MPGQRGAVGSSGQPQQRVRRSSLVVNFASDFARMREVAARALALPWICVINLIPGAVARSTTQITL